MATRFYLPSSGSTLISPSTSSNFDGSATTFFRAPLPTSPSGTAFRTDSQSVTGQNEEVYAQFVSQQLAAQSLAANSDVSWSIRAQGTDARYEVVIRIFQSDGTTVRGTFYAAEDLGQTWSGSLVSEFHTVTTGTSAISISDGDYLVFEVGAYDISSGSSTAALRFGDASATDLAGADDDSDDDNPWIEFEHNFVFKTTGGSGLMLRGIGG